MIISEKVSHFLRDKRRTAGTPNNNVIRYAAGAVNRINVGRAEITILKLLGSKASPLIRANVIGVPRGVIRKAKMYFHRFI